MVLRLTDADRRPSQVTQSPCLLHGDDEKFAKIANSDVAEKTAVPFDLEMLLGMKTPKVCQTLRYKRMHFYALHV